MLRRFYRYVLPHTIKHLMLYKVSLFVYRAVVLVLKPFSCSSSVYDIVTPIERHLGFARVLRAGDIAIQVGAVPRLYSHLFRIARTVGKNGVVIGIEANPQSIERLKKIASTNDFDCEFIFVNKATYSESGKARLFLGGKSGSFNRLELVPGAETVEKKGVVFVDVATIDSILGEIGIAPESVSYVNLTINGAEYETLKGMTNFLERSRHTSITVIAGRQEDRYLGEINQKPDHVVISDYLSGFGFDVKFKRFRSGRFGFVMGAKGNARFFM